MRLDNGQRVADKFERALSIDHSFRRCLPTPRASLLPYVPLTPPTPTNIDYVYFERLYGLSARAEHIQQMRQLPFHRLVDVSAT